MLPLPAVFMLESHSHVGPAMGVHGLLDIEKEILRFYRCSLLRHLDTKLKRKSCLLILIQMYFAVLFGRKMYEEIVLNKLIEL